MKLKTAIYIIEGITGIFILSGCLGIVLCILLLRQVDLAIGILTVVLLFIILPPIKAIIIKFYLKSCKYPFEFLSVLKQLKLMTDLQNDMRDNFRTIITNSKFQTEQFLVDNKLKTDFGKTINKAEPIVSFRENGLLINNNLYEWTTIKDWALDSDRMIMEINYIKTNISKKVFIDLERNNVNHIDLMLLLTHFKSKFSYQ